MSGADVVTRASLRKTLPILAPEPMTLLPARVWTQEEWRRIESGYRAQDMDEKWNVFVEDQVAFVHRSWTGNGAFEAWFCPVEGGWYISAAVAESSRKRVGKVSAELNRVLLQLVLDAIVLGEPAVGLRAELVRLASPENRAEPPAELIEHSILGLRSRILSVVARRAASPDRARFRCPRGELLNRPASSGIAPAPGVLPAAGTGIDQHRQRPGVAGAEHLLARKHPPGRLESSHLIISHADKLEHAPPHTSGAASPDS